MQTKLSVLQAGCETKKKTKQIAFLFTCENCSVGYKKNVTFRISSESRGPLVKSFRVERLAPTPQINTMSPPQSRARCLSTCARRALQPGRRQVRAEKLNFVRPVDRTCARIVIVRNHLPFCLFFQPTDLRIRLAG